jgi:hypothetical protein
VNKFGYVITLIIGVGAMLVIPSPIGHFAKASTCSVSIAKHGSEVSLSSTTSGGCSSGGSQRTVGLLNGAFSAGGGSKSSCTAASATNHQGPGDVSLSSSDSNGAVSCGAHSP